MDALLEKLVEENRPFTREGRVAGYIPELAKADRDELGICVVSSDGRISSAGEYRRTFTIQSIIKPILLLLAADGQRGGHGPALPGVGVGGHRQTL